MNIVLGLDYWQTISRNSLLFTMLASSILSEGGKVYIITAVGLLRSKSVSQDVESTGVPYTGLEILLFNHPREAPQLKLEAYRRLGCNMIMDDRRDICELANKDGILAFNLLRKDNKDYDPEKYKYDNR